MTSARSWLYVPGDQEGWLAKAQASEADRVIADLEDGVAAAGKDTAVALIAEHLRQTSQPLWVRVEPARLDTDLPQLLSPQLAGLVLPKAEIALVQAVNDLLDTLGARDLALLPLLESAVGLAEVRTLATLPRILRIGMGEADLAAALGLLPSPDRHELHPARAEVVLASALAGLVPPLGSTSTEIRDLEQVRASTEALLRQGFRGRTAIHPAQVSVINEVLTPTEAEIEHARAVVEAVERSGGAAVVDGRMVDAAVARTARDVITRMP